jgi:hypothetical protein
LCPNDSNIITESKCESSGNRIEGWLKNLLEDDTAKDSDHKSNDGHRIFNSNPMVSKDSDFKNEFLASCSKESFIHFVGAWNYQELDIQLIDKAILLWNIYKRTSTASQLETELRVTLANHQLITALSACASADISTVFCKTESGFQLNVSDNSAIVLEDLELNLKSWILKTEIAIATSNSDNNGLMMGLNDQEITFLTAQIKSQWDLSVVPYGYYIESKAVLN